jgi:hypothetical protein
MSSPRHLARAAGGCVGAAAAGALVAGVIDAAHGGGDALGLLTTVGLAALLAWPLATVGLALVRGMWRAWRVPALVEELREPSGGAPRLAAWVIFTILAAAALIAATAGAIVLQDETTAFKPGVVAVVTPAFVLVAAAALLTLSRPVVDALAAGLRRLERTRPRAWLRPRAIGFGALGVLVLGVGTSAWFVARPALAYYDTAGPLFVTTLIGGTAAAHQLARRAAPRRRALGFALASAACAGVIGSALWVTQTQPLTVLRVWAADDVAASLVEVVADLDAVRDGVRSSELAPPRRPGELPRSVILITIDTLRADRTPLGGGPAKMPALQALGERGAVFTRAYAPGNVTRRSVPSIITGLAAPRVRGKVAGWALRLDPRHVVLAERFAAAGYRTAGFMCCASFWSPEHKLGMSRGLGHLVIDKDGGKLAADAAAWIAAQGDAPYFVWLHFIEPHAWATADVDVAGKASKLDRYDAVLADVDDHLGTVLDALPTSGANVPFVVLTSDHGESLGEKGARFHASNLYEAQIHVPLVIAGPGLGARRIAEPVSGTSIAATTLELAGFEPPGMPTMDGPSLGPLARGTQAPKADQGAAYVVMIKDRSVKSGARAIVRGRWKLIVTGAKRELYDVIADRKEERDQLTKQPAIAAELQALLDERARVDRISALVDWQ